MNGMRIGIDITPLQVPTPGGIGTSTFETLKALVALGGAELVLYGTAAPVVPYSGEPLDLGLELRLGEGLGARSNILWIQRFLSPMLAGDRIDVFWGTRHVLPVRRDDTAAVATLYDFWYATHPQQQPPVSRMLNRYSMRSMVRSADVLTAISSATAADARALFPDAASRVRTVALGVDRAVFSPRAEAEVAAVLDRLGVRQPYVLAMDVYNPRKNALAVIEALGQVAEKVPDVTLVALGTPRTTAREVGIEPALTRAGIAGRAVLPGDVALDDLCALYSGAAVFAYPSVYEGFGMPVLEAMACGAPVITSTTSSLPEVAGTAALTVDPASVSALADVLVQVLTEEELRRRLRTAGVERAGHLTWARTAEGMMAAFEDAARLHRTGAVR
jgi:glycosyltransferase involved in cell wall biosynthesis